MVFPRLLPAPTETSFLLGPRATGKSTWIHQCLPGALIYDLLDTSLALRLAREPGLLAQELATIPAKRWVVIDEVQKVPALLDEVHRLMEQSGRRFLLSGSSARKLKRGGANLLGGRALRLSFFPLVSPEIGAAPGLESVPFGMLPKVVGHARQRAYLEAYVETYLKEEIQAEALTRNIGGFARFLDVAARQNGQVTNTANISRDAQIARQTVQGFFEVLVDTLIGFWLPAFKLKRATKLVAHPKFFFFDAGVARSLSGRIAYPPTPEELGTLFETYMLHELRAYLAYREKSYPLAYFRTHDGVEVDLIFETAKGFVAIELKSASQWRSQFNAGFRRVTEELDQVTCVGVFTGPRGLKSEFGHVLPYREFLQRLWADELVR